MCFLYQIPSAFESLKFLPFLEILLDWEYSFAIVKAFFWTQDMLTNTAVAYSYCKYLAGPLLTDFFFFFPGGGGVKSVSYLTKMTIDLLKELCSGFNVSVCWSVLSPAVRLQIHLWLPKRLTTKLKVLPRCCCWLYVLRPGVMRDHLHFIWTANCVQVYNLPRNHFCVALAFNLLLGRAYSLQGCFY